MMRKMLMILGLTAACALMSSLTGCGGRLIDISVPTRASIAAPQPPPILNTPAAFLLTNAPFAARVEVHGKSYSGSGTLFGRHGKLLFIPDEAKPDKYTPEGRFTFLWDVPRGEGWLMSEALQGYAPVTMTNLMAATSVSILPLEGKPGSRAETVTRADGKSVQFIAEQEQGPVPARITGGDPEFRAVLSKVSSKLPKEMTFETPSGFTKYASPEAMVDELAARFRNLKRKTY